MLTIVNLVILVPAILGTVGCAFWRMECPGFAGLARMDPLVTPGKPSNHVHAFFGSSALSMSSTNKELSNASCTSCRALQDKSGYWQPVLYFQDAETQELEFVGFKGDTGEGNAGILAYYKLLNNNGTTEVGVTTFPPGFRMIAGSSVRRKPPVEVGEKYMDPDPPKSEWYALGQTSQSLLSWRAVGFNCIHNGNSNKTPEPTLFRHYLPEKSFIDGCEGGLRTEIVFPSCWNGKDIDSEGHNKHVVYPNLAEDGSCPEGFETRVPTLLYEGIWDTMKFVGRNGRYVLSNGDLTGFGLHADFMNGWDQDTLEAAVTTCHNPSGKIDDCPVFELQTIEEAAQCKIDLPEELDEDVIGPIPHLPGKNYIGGPDGLDGPAIAAVAPEHPSISRDVVPQPSSTVADESVAPIAGDSSLVLEQSASHTTEPFNSTSMKFSEQPPTTKPPSSSKDGVSYSVVSTEYRTEGNMVYEIVWEEAWVYVTEDVTSTTTIGIDNNHLRRGKRGNGHGYRRHGHN